MISGEFAGKTIDDLLIEADKIINEILPYFQTTSKPNKVKTSTDFESIKANTRIITTQPKPQQNNIKKVVFNSNYNSRSIYVPEQHPIKSEIYGLYYRYNIFKHAYLLPLPGSTRERTAHRSTKTGRCCVFLTASIHPYQLLVVCKEKIKHYWLATTFSMHSQ